MVDALPRDERSDGRLASTSPLVTVRHRSCGAALTVQQVFKNAQLGHESSLWCPLCGIEVAPEGATSPGPYSIAL